MLTKTLSLPIRQAIAVTEMAQLGTENLREQFLIESLFEADEIQLVYTHYDRVITGGAMPLLDAVELPPYENLKTDFFLKRRELGVINVGGTGSVTVDGETYTLNTLDGLYVGQGSQSVQFRSDDPATPARYFLMSAPAHHAYPTAKLAKEDANPTRLGARETANERTIYKYIHAGGLTSCQLVMGLTVLEPGSVWNTMPAHTHDRRMEVYCYFDLHSDHRVFHLMGPPQQTRHLVVANHQAVLSPPWSIHSGCGTSSYSFIWGMAGENMDFTDMDFTPISELK
ncbi:5-dehydro-4-deoxy-D-glucuronate isomerase [Rudanella paleaurantiibacter]|uniref:4-deoxy-L-threo-5-hexosulose-uronate ketol-isomerase n=1 Tax=Rudanella paleaurantiibacter TaxID=2614655 RepID=A0A7J5U0D2_9BACT|nr:5-dehydro-4-deoxy-D-glucuronate isomerase [Rudanella paleaurantiibacter]KAB7731105.1 5-dehydro-4-deoxy-D-glucuronate isomerase [Rudanella paleaurantiibacter]